MLIDPRKIAQAIYVTCIVVSFALVALLAGEGASYLLHLIPCH